MGGGVGGAGGGAKSYDQKKSWFSINYSILSGDYTRKDLQLWDSGTERTRGFDNQSTRGLKYQRLMI